jgi:hypothetical protein
MQKHLQLGHFYAVLYCIEMDTIEVEAYLLAKHPPKTEHVGHSISEKKNPSKELFLYFHQTFPKRQVRRFRFNLR